jgi:hypothetical protein
MNWRLRIGTSSPISQNINIIDLSVAYVQSEEKIKGRLLALQQYLEHIPAIIIEKVYWAKLLSVQIRDAALAAEASLEIIRFYRLYHNVAFGFQCHGQKMRKNFEFIFSIIMTGL